MTFLSLLQAQKILTETELAFVEAQAERWTSAVQIADLLQLEQFPPAADAPATIATDDTTSALREAPGKAAGAARDQVNPPDGRQPGKPSAPGAAAAGRPQPPAQPLPAPPAAKAPDAAGRPGSAPAVPAAPVPAVPGFGR